MGLGSGIRKKPIPDPGSRGQKGTGSWIRIRNTALTVLLSKLLPHYHLLRKNVALSCKQYRTFQGNYF